MMALVGVKLKTLVFELDAMTTRPPPCALVNPNDKNQNA